MILKSLQRISVKMRADDSEKMPHNFSISPTNQVINNYFGGIGFAAIASQQERRVFTMVRKIPNSLTFS